MTLPLTHTQSLILAQNTDAPEASSELAEIRVHLGLLVPGDSSAALHDVQDYALAYITQYHANTLALEHEWDFLTATLAHAWRQENYEVVARLAAALAYPAGRRQNFAEAKRVLQLGIVASRRIQNRCCFASLLNRLGGLMFTHGAYQRGYRLWQTGLYHIESNGPPLGLWEPLYSFTYIADMLGNYAAAQHFLETFYGVSRGDDLDGLAVALFARGLYARFMCNMESASVDYSHSLRLLLSQTLSPARQFFMVVVQAELARAQGQYVRAQQYTQTALALAQASGDLHIFATLLIDEGIFAHIQGQFDDMQRVFSCLRAIESRVSFPNVAAVTQTLEQQLLASSAYTPQDQQILEPTIHTPVYSEKLSTREIEVLQLVAEGLSSREIAERLVITPATVKKHLEHIYTGLDVHTRTAAVAQARRLYILS
jgi:DNA-binding CsgD family transcriptional regulator